MENQDKIEKVSAFFKGNFKMVETTDGIIYPKGKEPICLELPSLPDGHGYAPYHEFEINGFCEFRVANDFVIKITQEYLIILNDANVWNKVSLEDLKSIGYGMGSYISKICYLDD